MVVARDALVSDLGQCGIDDLFPLSIIANTRFKDNLNIYTAPTFNLIELTFTYLKPGFEHQPFPPLSVLKEYAA